MGRKKTLNEEAHDQLGQSFEHHLSTLRSKSRRQVKRHSMSSMDTSFESDEYKKSKVCFCWLLVVFFCTAIVIGGYYGFEYWRSLPSYPWKTLNGVLPSNIDTPKQYKTLIKDFDNKFDDAYISKKLKNLRLTEVLVDHNRRTEMRKVPLLLDILGTGSEYLSPVLTKCLGLSSSSNFPDFETENSPNFAVTNKLCGMAKKFKVGKALLMVVMRNPVERVVQEYLTLLNEKKISARSVAAYVRSPSFVDNRQTRILICKPKGEVNENDFNTAKYILENMSVLSMYQDYSNSFEHYREAFSWTRNNTSKAAINNSNKCIEDEFLKSASLTAKGLEKRLNEKNVVKYVRDKNQFDMKLYLYVKQYIKAI